MRKARLAAMAMAGVLVAGLAGCATSESSPGEEDAGTVGVVMPTRSSERWIQDGDTMKALLEEQGFTVDLQYAEDDIPTQVAQLENMITRGVDALIIAPIDGTTLTGVLDQAGALGIPVIAYDRLLLETENVDYYVSFDDIVVGQNMAWAMTSGLGLTDLEGNPIENAPSGPFNIELFAGSPDSSNTPLLFDGAMQVLQPFIDDGTLVVKSGQTDLSQISTLRWDGEAAQSRMEDLITAHYSDGSRVHAVLSPYDGISRGIISALQGAGYTVGDGWPFISGQDAEIDSVQAVLRGEQHATVFKDTRELARAAVSIVTAVLSGETPSAVNNTTDYDNGVKVVPTALLGVTQVVADNVFEVLVDSGYLTEEQITG